MDRYKILEEWIMVLWMMYIDDTCSELTAYTFYVADVCVCVCIYIYINFYYMYINYFT
jgi:hypothetical protein